MENLTVRYNDVHSQWVALPSRLGVLPGRRGVLHADGRAALLGRPSHNVVGVSGCGFVFARLRVRVCICNLEQCRLDAASGLSQRLSTSQAPFIITGRPSRLKPRVGTSLPGLIPLLTEPFKVHMKTSEYTSGTSALHVHHRTELQLTRALYLLEPQLEIEQIIWALHYHLQRLFPLHRTSLLSRTNRLGIRCLC